MPTNSMKKLTKVMQEWSDRCDLRYLQKHALLKKALKKSGGEIVRFQPDRTLELQEAMRKEYYLARADYSNGYWGTQKKPKKQEVVL